MTSPLAFRRVLALTTLLSCSALSAFAQFSDTFDAIDPAWTTDRYEPAGFSSVFFDGDNRLQITVDASGSAANRPAAFSSSFYNTQGRQRAVGTTGAWTLSADVFVAAAFNTTTGELARSDLWGHTGTTPSGGDYPIFGFTNASPTDAFNAAAADRSFRFRAYDGDTGNWVNLTTPGGFTFDAWHNLAIVSTGTEFRYYLDGSLLHTDATTAGNDLMSAFIEAYNFGGAGYAVQWDNAAASAIPEPATAAALVAASTLVVVAWRRQRRG